MTSQLSIPREVRLHTRPAVPRDPGRQVGRCHGKGVGGMPHASEELQSHLQKRALTPTHHSLGLHHQFWGPTTGNAVVPRGPSLGIMDVNGAMDLPWAT